MIGLNYLAALSRAALAGVGRGYTEVMPPWPEGIILMQKIKLPDRRILVIIVVVVVAALALTAYLARQRQVGRV